MRGCLATVEETRTSEQESTRAYRGDGSRGRGALAQEGQDQLILDACPFVGTRATGHDERIESRAVLEDMVGTHTEAASTPDLPPWTHRDDAHVRKS